MRRAEWFLVLALVFVLAACSGGTKSNKESSSREGKPRASAFQRILKTQKMDVGYINFEPFSYKDSKTGEIKGIFVDAIKNIASSLNAKVVFHEATWSTFIAGLQTRQFDISIAPTYATIKRAASVAFTRPIIYVGNSAVVRKNDPRFKNIKSIYQLNRPDLVIAVTQGEQGQEFAQKYLKKAKIRVIASGDQFLTFAEVSTGRADVALGDMWAVHRYVSKHPDVRDLFANRPYNLIGVSWAVRYEDLDLLTFLNTALGYLETTGFWERVDKKYGTKWAHPKLLLETY